MMNIELSHFEGLLIVVWFKDMILWKIAKYNFSLNGIHAVKYGWTQDQPYSLNYLSPDMTD